jgi:tetratricopeptide (TPR) repeat protein
MVVYDAFISYNHAKDRAVATRLQRLMQRLGKPWYQRRAMRVFRDDTSLSATPHLWPSIEEALKASRYLVLIGSPEAAASRWVSQETQFWIEQKNAETLLLALTAGELAWDRVANDFVWSDASPLPASLKGRFAHEPKWIDLRAFRETAHGSTEELLAAADLAAAIRGVPKEDLLSEEVRQHRRAMTLSGFAAACLFVLAVAATWQWREAIAQRDRAENILRTTILGANDLVLNFGVQMRHTLGVPRTLVDDFLNRLIGIQRGLVKYDAANIKLKRAQAVALRTQSQALSDEGDVAEALDKAQQSSQIIRSLISPTLADPDLQFELSHSLDREGEALAVQLKHRDALERFKQALAIRQQLAQLPTPDDALADARQRDLAVALERTGDEYDKLQDFDAAADMYRASFKIRQSRHQTKPDDPDAAEDLAVGYDRMAHIDQEQNSGDPIQQWTRSIEIREGLVRRNPLNANWQHNLALDYATLGYFWLSSGNPGNALGPLQRALKIRQLLAERNPDVPKWQFDLAATLYYLAQCESEDTAERPQQLQQALDIITRLEHEPAQLPNLAALRVAVQKSLNRAEQ